jgi:multiple sugar transport system substrate-binding protein
MRLTGERVVHRVRTIDEAVVELDRKTDEILAKRRWMLEQNTLPQVSSAGSA